MEANSRENGMVAATMSRAADIAQEEEENDRNQDHSFGQVVQHGVAGEVNQSRCDR